MDNQNIDKQNNEYKSVDGEVWGSIEETEQANQAWYDATILNEEHTVDEEKTKTRR